VSESLEVSLTEPEILKALLEKVTRYLIRYLTAFREAGVHGVIMAEPAAGLLSPRGLSQFSSVYVKQIIESTVTPDFTVVLHNCGAKLVHLPKVLEAGAEIFHFGAPMDIGQALAQVGEDIILSGNLDPTGVFHNGNPQEVTARTRELLQAAAGHRNFIPSSGCDIPPHSPLGNLAAFYDKIRG
jgi:uroporphyrinogen decarboxylase